jgi:eukaryotic-like serine/threonine-protein kinase
MADPAERFKDLFAAAAELPPAGRERFLAEECGDDRELCARLETLLRAHDEVGDFLEEPATLDRPFVEHEAEAPWHAGQRIGDYELVAELGRGGGGVVWRARQLEPVQRDVALKILFAPAPGGELPFEPRSLARMQHPGINSLFAAGTTDDGLPWLAMQLVDGEPITRFCARNHTPLGERLRLFLDVCHAVQHAHHKGIAHHDLKPGNVLVTERDGERCPVVIDFGIARPASPPASVAAGTTDVAGTPDYMSPEQIDGDARAVDARADVYALGVLLYELACGERPFVHRGERVPLAERLRRLREDEPVPPSRRAAERLPREVDWITQRAMAKHPDLRYQTVAALADDVRRWRAGEPVAAGPSTLGYRLRCVWRRHRAAACAAIVLVGGLGLGAAVAAHGWWRAAVASQEANRALDLLDELWSRSDPGQAGRPDGERQRDLAAALSDLPAQARGEPRVELRLQRALASLQRYLGHGDAAVAHADRAVELAEAQGAADFVGALLQRGMANLERGDVTAAEQDARAAIDGAAAANATPALATAHALLADCLGRRGDHVQALLAADTALGLRRRIDEPRALAQSLLQLAGLRMAIGNLDESLAALDEAMALQEPLGEDHPDVLVAWQGRAILLRQKGDLVGAEAAMRNGLERRRRVHGEGHPRVAWAEVELAWVLHERGDDAAAEPLLAAAKHSLRASLGDGHVQVTEAMSRHGSVLAVLGRHDEAATELRLAIERYRNLAAHPPEGLVAAIAELAKLQWRRGDRPGGLALQHEAVAIARGAVAEDHYVLSVALTHLATMLAETGERARAIELLEEALARSTRAGRTAEAAVQRARLDALR